MSYGRPEMGDKRERKREKSTETGRWEVHWIAGGFVKCSPNESVGWPGVWRACYSHCEGTIAQVLRENHAKRKKSGFAVHECTGGRATAGGGRYDKDDWGTWGTREKESIEKQNDKSQCARGLPRFRTRNSTMPENKEPPVRGVEAFFLAFIHFWGKWVKWK